MCTLGCLRTPWLVLTLLVVFVKQFACKKSMIAYGGVLNKRLVTSSNNSDIIKAAEHCLLYVSKRFNYSVPINNDGAIDYSYKILKPKKLKLVYTADGKETYKIAVHSGDSVVQSDLHWGYTYSFMVAWETSPWQHSFVVTHYWDNQLYLYTHTFSKRTSHCHTDSLADSSSNLQFSESEKCELSHEQQERQGSHMYSRYGGGQLVKVLSYNIWNVNSVGGGDYGRRIQALAQACRKADADVIAFQEVRFQDGAGGQLGPSQVAHLASQLTAYQFVYQPAQIQLDGLPHRVEEGVAIFSKFPIISHDYILLDRNPHDPADGHQRILLHAEIQLPSSQTIHVLNTHLSLSHKARAVAVSQIWSHLQAFQGPVFLMGDFNAEAHNREIQFLAGEESIEDVKTSGLLDSWKVKYGIKHLGYTFSTLEDELTKRIDFIFYLDLPYVSLADITLLDDGGRGANASSDHLGVLGNYLIKRNH